VASTQSAMSKTSSQSARACHRSKETPSLAVLTSAIPTMTVNRASTVRTTNVIQHASSAERALHARELSITDHNASVHVTPSDRHLSNASTSAMEIPIVQDISQRVFMEFARIHAKALVVLEPIAIFVDSLLFAHVHVI
jgi:hypothetical protein